MNTATIFVLMGGGALIAFPFGFWFGCLYSKDRVAPTIRNPSTASTQ